MRTVVLIALALHQGRAPRRALRFGVRALLAVHAQLVALPFWRDSYAVMTSIEPFLRIGHVDGKVGYFGRLSALVELGPDALWGPFVDPRGSVALRVGGGALF